MALSSLSRLYLRKAWRLCARFKDWYTTGDIDDLAFGEGTTDWTYIWLQEVSKKRKERQFRGSFFVFKVKPFYVSGIERNGVFVQFNSQYLNWPWNVTSSISEFMLKMNLITPHIGARIRRSISQDMQCDWTWWGLSGASNPSSDFSGWSNPFAQTALDDCRAIWTSNQRIRFPRVEHVPQVSVIETTRGEKYSDGKLLAYGSNMAQIASSFSVACPTYSKRRRGYDLVFDDCCIWFIRWRHESKSWGAYRRLIRWWLLKVKQVGSDWASWHKSSLKIKTAQENPQWFTRLFKFTFRQVKRRSISMNNLLVIYRGLDLQESDVLLNQLFEIARTLSFKFVSNGIKGTMAIWDNRVTQHYAVIDYGDTPEKCTESVT